MNFLKHSILLVFLFVTSNASAQISDFKDIDFRKADMMAKLNGGKPLDNIPLLAHNLTSRLDTDVEKFRSIYVWVCSNIKSDIRLSDMVSRKRKKYQNDTKAYLDWNADWQKKAFKRLLKEQKTMCTGYSYLIKELCFLANIEAEIINGYARTAETNVKSLDLVNHSWNAVMLNNKWYLCDATWSSGYVLNDLLFVKDYNEGYFLADPLLFGNSHHPSDKKWFLNDKLAHTEFIATPLVYGETFKHQIIPISPATMDIETTINDILIFSFETAKPFTDDQIQLVYYSGQNERAFDIQNFKNDKGLISFKYQFKHKGSFDVHLKIADDIVATYTIIVTKTDIKTISLVKNR